MPVMQTRAVVCEAGPGGTMVDEQGWKVFLPDGTLLAARADQNCSTVPTLRVGTWVVVGWTPGEEFCSLVLERSPVEWISPSALEARRAKASPGKQRLCMVNGQLHVDVGNGKTRRFHQSWVAQFRRGLAWVAFVAMLLLLLSVVLQALLVVALSGLTLAAVGLLALCTFPEHLRYLYNSLVSRSEDPLFYWFVYCSYLLLVSMVIASFYRGLVAGG